MKKIITTAALILLVLLQVFSQTKAGKTDTMRHTAFSTRSTNYALSIKEKMKADVAGIESSSTVINVTNHDPSQCPQCGVKRNLSAKEEMKAEVTKLYTCPMHPQTALDKNGVCSRCVKERVNNSDNS